jgi:hypothetical protein
LIALKDSRRFPASVIAIRMMIESIFLFVPFMEIFLALCRDEPHLEEYGINMVVSFKDCHAVTGSVIIF